MEFNLLLLLLIGHFIGDFYFQSDEIARNKNHKISKLFKHCFFYLIAMIIVILPIFSLDTLICSLAISFIHFVVDLIKSKIKCDEKREPSLFIADQVIHLSVIIGTSLFISQNYNVLYIAQIRNLMHSFSINDLKILSVVLAFLITLKPSRILIKKVLSKYGSFSDDAKEGIPNTGALIGELERLIIMLMLTQAQYAAIGFILTAKSVARYKKIVDSAKFSEYYLLGTFLSTLIVILTYLIILKPFWN